MIYKPDFLRWEIPQPGVEPGHSRLMSLVGTVCDAMRIMSCPYTRSRVCMKKVMKKMKNIAAVGFEPTLTAKETVVLPDYTKPRCIKKGTVRISAFSSNYSSIIPIDYRQIFFLMTSRIWMLPSGFRLISTLLPFFNIRLTASYNSCSVI